MKRQNELIQKGKEKQQASNLPGAIDAEYKVID